LPDKDALRDAAIKCKDKFRAFSRKHEEWFMLKGGKAPPLVKYQLPATVRAVGEKVATQLAARAGKASFTGMYELVRDVPNRGRDPESTQMARDLMDAYNGKLDKAWGPELKKRSDELKGVDKELNKALEAKFKEFTKDKKPVVDMPAALSEWRKSFADADFLKHNQESLRRMVRTAPMAATADQASTRWW
jgi:hypothetical protein